MKPVPAPLLDADIDELTARLSGVAGEFHGRTVLLFGGCGFLGRYFMEWLTRLNETRGRAKACRVIVYDSLMTSSSQAAAIPKSPHLTFTQHNITEPIPAARKPDFIVHMAGIASPFYYRAYPLQTLDVAVTGTRNLLELARKSKSRMVFFSSSEIYGDPDAAHVPTPESYRGNVSSLGPRACYDESKRLGETLCWIYHQTFGTLATMVRPFNVYGPGMKENDYRVLPNFASRIKAGKPLRIYGTGRQTRTFCYVTDAIEGFVRTLLKGNPGEAYNIGNPKPEVSMLELVKTTSRALGRPVPFTRIEYPDSYPADEPQRRAPDITKARLQLDFRPRVALEEGLRRSSRWTDKVYSGDSSA